MSQSSFALDLAQIAHPPSTAADGLAACTDCCAVSSDDSDRYESLRNSSPVTPYTGKLDTSEAEHPNGPDRGVFENAWKAVASWLERANSDPASELEGK